MTENKIIGYKNIFGFILPDWVDEGIIRLLVTFMLSLAAMLFVLLFVIWPKLSTISELRSSLKTGEASLSALKNSKMGFDRLSEQIPEATQNLILSAIPTTYSPESAVSLLRKISEGIPGLSIVSYKLPSGVLFEDVGAKTKKGTDNDKDMVIFLSYPIRLTVMAPIASLLEFINKVETSLPLGVVSDLGMQEVSKLVKSTSSMSVQIELEISFYQALLKQVDITRIKPISDEDLVQVKKITGFSRVGSTEGLDRNLLPVVTGSSNSLFGF